MVYDLDVSARNETGIAPAAAGLRLDGHGIWTSGRTAKVSYPETDNQECFQLEDDSYWFRHRNDCIASIVRRFPPPGRILDVGGGNGYVTRRLLDEGVATTLLEPGPAGAMNARMRRGIPEVICASLEDAKLPAGALGAVGCFDVIEHVQADREFMVQLHGLLKPHGLLYATVPAFDWLWSASDVAAQHHRRYDRASMGRLLRDGGFELLYFSYVFAPLMLPIALLRSLPFRMGLITRRGVLSSETEHGAGGGVVVQAMTKLLAIESARIARGGTSGIGTSCLVVARRSMVGARA